MTLPIAHAARLTPLPAILAFTFLNSVGTGVVTSGIFFVTKQGYAFSDRENFVLGIVLGVTYIIGAMGAGPAVRLLKRTLRASDRMLLAALMALLALLCLVPITTQAFAAAGSSDAGSSASGSSATSSPMGPLWPIWCMVGLYSALTGVLWPMVESYLTGGRTASQQRGALGIWNTLWSSALVIAYWAISPFIANFAPQVLAGLSLMHVAAAACLAWFTALPAAHTHESHEAEYGAEHASAHASQGRELQREQSLLAVFRVLLPLSYVLSSALSPYLAGLLERLAVSKDYRTFIASAWLLPRVLTFFVLHKWSAWYGTLTAPVAGVTLLLLGFTSCTLASLASSTPVALSVIIGGLALFGVGMGTIYTGAISYAMRVGKAQVDAGGTHEALIGLGYLLGPSCGLAALLLAPSNGAASQGAAALSFDRLFLLLIIAITLILLALATRAGLRAAKG